MNHKDAFEVAIDAARNLDRAKIMGKVPSGIQKTYEQALKPIESFIMASNKELSSVVQEFSGAGLFPNTKAQVAANELIPGQINFGNDKAGDELAEKIATVALENNIDVSHSTLGGGHSLRFAPNVHEAEDRPEVLLRALGAWAERKENKNLAKRAFDAAEKLHAQAFSITHGNA